MIFQLQRWVLKFKLENVLFKCEHLPFPYPSQNNIEQFKKIEEENNYLKR